MKRSHGEDEDLDLGVYPKPPSSTVSNISHSHEVSKLPRPDSRDSDRRSPLHSVYRMPSSSSTELPLGHPDNNAKEKDDSKEMKCDKDALTDSKDGFGAATTTTSHLNPKDIQRGMRYSEAPHPWPILSTNLQVPPEAGKEGSATEEKEACETVGENKVDMKGDDKSKDKDRKHKDLKHRDWVERDKDRTDRRIIQVGHSKSEFNELVKEDREADRWEREKKETTKEKERIKDREKDYIKRELWNGAEKESFNGDKDTGDKPIRVPEQETSTMELKKQDYDAIRNIEREGKDRRKERDADVEGDRPEKRSRFYDKEPEDGSLDGEGVLEREREVFNHGVQQRKRMLRPRGSPQVMNREPRFRSRAQDNEGSQGKVEVSSVVYKIGECMQELTKLWKEYDPSQADKNGESSQGGPTLEIRIPAEHVTATNRQVRGGQLWGTDIYTDDSDLVAVLMHTGYCRPTASPPPPAIQELRATIRVLPPQDGYISTLRNNVRSRAWGAAIGCSYRVERCCIMKKGGGAIDLEPCLTHTSAVEPTLAPLAVERTMTTRAAASNALRQQRFIREVTIQYNLCNEPWTKYSISIVADKGLKKPLYTSARLKKGEVLYLETHSCRYELCFTGEKVVKGTSASQVHEAEPQNVERDNIMIDVFRWSCCKNPLPQNLMRSVGIPLPQEYVEVLEENLDWEDVQWSQTGVWIAGKEYVLARVHFLPPN